MHKEAAETSAGVRGQHEISSLSVSDEEISKGSLEPANLERASQLFDAHGYLRVENLFNPSQIGAIAALYNAKYRNFLTATNKPDKRPLFTVDIEGPFNDPQVLTNPLIKPLLAQFLGDDFIVSAVSAVASFPGAPDQHLHRDAKQLFGKDNEADKDVPAYSIAMLVPLIDFTLETGCTRVWPGSHRIAGREAGLAAGSLDPEVKAGSVLLTDGRLLHRGAANRSKHVRPLFYATYHRSWYRDFGGYENRPPINLAEREYEKMAPEFQARFAWTRDRYRSIKRKYWLRRVLPASLRVRLARDI